MSAHSPVSAAPDAAASAWRWQLAVVVIVSLLYEGFFVQFGLNHLDEIWPLYAAMRLKAGGTLYEDALWVFPPGHMWMAWLAHTLHPPGVLGARVLYALWSVALSGAMYLLGRRLMPEHFAFLGALLLAVAAPRTHLLHAIFGYRYLVLTVLVLLCFHRRLETGESRWMLPAGLLAGVALVFRLTPAFAVSCGVVIGTLAASRAWRDWVRDWLWYGIGLVVAAAPVLAWFHGSIGVAALWHEVVIHPLGMLQDLPWPPLVSEEPFGREAIWLFFVALSFRLCWVLYVAYGGVLLGSWGRAVWRGERYRHALLLAVVTWGAVFFIRSLGRSDEPHLDSVLPPVCLLIAHALAVGYARLWPRLGWPEARRTGATAAVGATVLVGWVLLGGVDATIWKAVDQRIPFMIGDERVFIQSPARSRMLNELLHNIENKTRPDATILDMAAAPLFYLASGRMGPGTFDIVMPGTFGTEEEELAFVERLRLAPPAMVIWPAHDFDDLPERSIHRIAPHLASWVQEHYHQVGPMRRYLYYAPGGR